MFSRPFSFVGRTLLAGCAFGLGVMALHGQASSSLPAAPTAKPDAPVSRADVFMGYSYLAPHGTVTTTMDSGAIDSTSFSSVDLGAIGSFAYYFNRYVGGQFEYANGPNGQNDGISTAQGGIIFRYPTDQGMTPFVHGLA
ncbi:MAG: hypothetical protein WBD93_13565, partial [Acidobacteriaceae bacterium]